MKETATCTLRCTLAREVEGGRPAPGLGRVGLRGRSTAGRSSRRRVLTSRDERSDASLIPERSRSRCQPFVAEEAGHGRTGGSRRTELLGGGPGREALTTGRARGRAKATWQRPWGRPDWLCKNRGSILGDWRCLRLLCLRVAKRRSSERADGLGDSSSGGQEGVVGRRRAPVDESLEPRA
jgi:hypothetical protein